MVARKGRKRCKDDEADLITVRRDRVAARRMRPGACIVRAFRRVWLPTGWQAGALRRQDIRRTGRRLWPCHLKPVTQWTMCAAISSIRTVLRLQAKRKCGNDKHLASTRSRSGQLPSLGPGNRVGLATAEPQGPVRHLAAALARHSRAVRRSRPTSRMRWQPSPIGCPGNPG